MYGSDLRWRAVTLVNANGVPVLSASRLLGVSVRAIRRWYKQFMTEEDERSYSEASNKWRQERKIVFFALNLV
jgi:hypothetical protein